MRYLSLFSCSIFILFFCTVGQLKATHLMGGDLTYSCQGNGEYTVTLKVYRDCNGINVGSIELFYISGSCGSGYQYMSKISEHEITPTCPGLPGTVCNGGNYTYGVEEHIYQSTVTLSTNCSDVKFYWRRCCRNYAITTLSTPGSENMYLETSMPDVTVCNNSPIFLNIPVPFVCVGYPVSYNHGAYDEDGDELRYSLVDCRNNDGDPVSYSNGFSATDPITTASGITIDSISGTITFTPTVSQVAVMCVLVEEYRNGVKISEIVRDIQFTTLACSNNSPTATGMDSTTSFVVDAKVGDNVNFDIYSNDINAGQIVSMNWNNGVPGGAFTVDNSSTYPKGNFTWVPTLNDIGSNTFNVVVADDFCPLVGQNTYSYTINVSIDTIFSVKDGDWNQASTWSCNCVPPVDKNIVIDHDISINSNVYLENGSFVRLNAGRTITVADGVDFQISGDINCFGDVNGKLILNGSQSKYARVRSVDILEVNNSLSIQMASDLDIRKALILTQGTFSSNGYDVRLKSDADGSAMVIPNGGTSVGDLIIERHVHNALGSHFISSPVVSATLNELDDDFNVVIAPTASSIYYYDETNTAPIHSQGWEKPTGLNDLLEVGKGYSAYFNASTPIVLDIKGRVNDGDVTIALSKTDSDTTNGSTDPTCPPEGWNLIGNPYPAPIDFRVVVAESNGTIENAMYRWDPVSMSSVSYIDGIGVPASTGPFIPAMQGFWVKATADAQNLVITNNARVTDINNINSTFYRPSNYEPLLRFKISGQGFDAESVVRFKDGASNGFDPSYDAYYLPSGNPIGIEFSSLIDNLTISVNSLAPLTDPSMSIPFNTFIGTTGTYNFEIIEYLSQDPDISVYLYDAITLIEHPIDQSNYVFSASANDPADRFELRFYKNTGQPTNVQVNDASSMYDFRAYRNTNQLVIDFQNIQDEDAPIVIYNQLGQVIYETVLNAGQDQYLLPVGHLLSSPQIYYIKNKHSQIAKAFNW